jgi:dipeptidase
LTAKSSLLTLLCDFAFVELRGESHRKAREKALAHVKKHAEEHKKQVEKIDAEFKDSSNAMFEDLCRTEKGISEEIEKYVVKATNDVVAVEVSEVKRWNRSIY